MRVGEPIQNARGLCERQAWTNRPLPTPYSHFKMHSVSFTWVESSGKSPRRTTGATSHCVWSPPRHSAELVSQTGASFGTASVSLADVPRRKPCFVSSPIFQGTKQGLSAPRLLARVFVCNTLEVIKSVVIFVISPLGWSTP